MQNERPLTGYRVLIIEDEVMQAWGLSGMVADLGGTVGSIAYSHEQARRHLAPADASASDQKEPSACAHDWSAAG